MRELHRQSRGDRRRGSWMLVGFALAWLTVTGSILWALMAAPVAAEGLPRLVISPTVVDFGTIQKSGGKVEATFSLRNDGRAPLRIQRIVPT